MSSDQQALLLTRGMLFHILPQDYDYVISLLVIVVVSPCRNTTIRLW